MPPEAPRNQHYVPQFLLRNFGIGKKHKLFILDKHKGIVFSTIPRNVAAERDFYNFEFEGQVLSLETNLAAMERMAKDVINKILKQHTLQFLNHEELAYLGVFIGAQDIRDRQQREQLRSLNVQMTEKLSKLGMPPQELEMSDEAIKLLTLRMLGTTVADFALALLDKEIFLAQAPKGYSFWISDSPVVMSNSIKFDGIKGNLGYQVEGIEIYFPLSPQIALCFMCRGIKDYLSTILNETNALWQRYASTPSYQIDKKSRLRELIEQRAGKSKSASEVLNAMSTKGIFQMTPENVEHLNSLQVVKSYRYLFSAEDNFKLAFEMMAEHPDLKTGRTMTVM